MSGFDDFKEGERVAHFSMGDGTVEKTTGAVVVVKFDKWKSRGEYDRRWFELYPTHLFHRSTPITTGERADG